MDASSSAGGCRQTLRLPTGCSQSPVDPHPDFKPNHGKLSKGPTRHESTTTSKRSGNIIYWWPSNLQDHEWWANPTKKCGTPPAITGRPAWCKVNPSAKSSRARSTTESSQIVDTSVATTVDDHLTTVGNFSRLPRCNQGIPTTFLQPVFMKVPPGCFPTLNDRCHGLNWQVEGMKGML